MTKTRKRNESYRICFFINIAWYFLSSLVFGDTLIHPLIFRNYQITFSSFRTFIFFIFFLFLFPCVFTLICFFAGQNNEKLCELKVKLYHSQLKYRIFISKCKANNV